MGSRCRPRVVSDPGARMNAPARAGEMRLVACEVCRLVCEAPAAGAPLTRCVRCNTPLHYRKRDGTARAWALLITAMVLYVPTNLFPVAYTHILGQEAESTIFGGIVDFWMSGSPGLALLIFVASVVVPTGKFLSLAVLLVSTQRASTGRQPERARLYRLLEIVGHWSMLDVLVVGWASALGNFGTLSAAEPRVGILFFGLVVILTILSANSFDPRAMWDSKKHA